VVRGSSNHVYIGEGADGQPATVALVFSKSRQDFLFGDVNDFRGRAPKRNGGDLHRNPPKVKKKKAFGAKHQKRPAPLRPGLPHPYFVWVVLGVTGKMAEADDLYRAQKAAIDAKVRDFQRQQRGPLPTVYRGVLLEPHEIRSGEIDFAYGPISFVSFTEDRDLACWFADGASVMSSFVVSEKPGVKGYVLEIEPDPRDVLFRATWVSLEDFRGAIATLMTRGFSSEQARQFVHNLETQSEIWMKPLARRTPVMAHEAADCPSTEELDERYLAPWLKGLF